MERTVTSVQHIYNVLEQHPGAVIQNAATVSGRDTMFLIRVPIPPECWKGIARQKPSFRRTITEAIVLAPGCSAVSSEKLLQILVDTANTPEVVRGIRNAMIIAKIADAIDPNLLESLERAVPEGLAEAQKPKPLGYWQLLKKLLSRDTRRVLVAGACVLESLGKSLGSQGPRGV